MTAIIHALQKMEDRQMKAILQAVIAQDQKVLAQLAKALETDSKQVEFLVIAECANRWLTMQK